MYDYRLFNMIRELVEALGKEGMREPGTGIIEVEIAGLPIFWDLDRATVYPRLPHREMQ
jgi:hypothetical protein